jgi:hypothetical protein
MDGREKDAYCHGLCLHQREVLMILLLQGRLRALPLLKTAAKE